MSRERAVKARIFVTLKRSVLDPQGKAIQGALESLGYGEVEEVRVGKVIEVTLSEEGSADVRGRLEEMCRKLLANPVIEDFHLEVETGSTGRKNPA